MLEQVIENPDASFTQIQEVLDPFLDRFKQVEHLFIQSIADQESAPGDYFNKHQHIVGRQADPVRELTLFQENLLRECERLGITCTELREYRAQDIAAYMPREVLPLSSAENQQQELEEELELNTQKEEEKEEEQMQEVTTNTAKVDSYLPRESGLSHYNLVSAPTLHKAFDTKIFCTDSYMPLQRQDPLHRRRPFDDRMGRIGIVEVFVGGYPSHEQCDKIVIGDLLDRVDYKGSLGQYHFSYDIRLNRIIESLFDQRELVNTERFCSLIAQIKFMDGMTDGYTPKEVSGLRYWLQENDPLEMLHFFTQTILKHRPENRFAHSQLYNIFASICNRALA